MSQPVNYIKYDLMSFVHLDKLYINSYERFAFEVLRLLEIMHHCLGPQPVACLLSNRYRSHRVPQIVAVGRLVWTHQFHRRSLIAHRQVLFLWATVWIFLSNSVWRLFLWFNPCSQCPLFWQFYYDLWLQYYNIWNNKLRSDRSQSQSTNNIVLSNMLEIIYFVAIILFWFCYCFDPMWKFSIYL